MTVNELIEFLKQIKAGGHGEKQVCVVEPNEYYAIEVGDDYKIVSVDNEGYISDDGRNETVLLKKNYG